MGAYPTLLLRADRVTAGRKETRNKQPIAVIRLERMPRLRAFRDARTCNRAIRPGGGGTRSCLPVTVRSRAGSSG